MWTLVIKIEVIHVRVMKHYWKKRSLEMLSLLGCSKFISLWAQLFLMRPCPYFVCVNVYDRPSCIYLVSWYITLSLAVHSWMRLLRTLNISIRRTAVSFEIVRHTIAWCIAITKSNGIYFRIMNALKKKITDASIDAFAIRIRYMQRFNLLVADQCNVCVM